MIAAKSVERNAGQNEAIGIDAVPSARQRRNEERSTEARGKSDRWGRGCGDSGENGQRDGSRRTRADTGEVRVDERIAQHALQHRAGKRQRGSDGSGDADARQTQLPNDGRERSGCMRMRQRRDDVTSRDLRSTDEQAEAGASERKERKRREPKRAALHVTSFAFRRRLNVPAAGSRRRARTGRCPSCIRATQ